MWLNENLIIIIDDQMKYTNWTSIDHVCLFQVWSIWKSGEQFYEVSTLLGETLSVFFL